MRCQNNVVYIRHKLNDPEDGDVVEKLFEKGKIAYHNNEEDHDANYAAGYSPAKIFQELVDAPAEKIIIAEYHDDKFLVGRVMPQSVMLVNNACEKIDGGRVYKTLQLTEFEPFSATQFPIYLATRPAYSTCCHVQVPFLKVVLPAIYRVIRQQKTAKNVDQIEKIPVTVGVLHPAGVEQLSEEFLRRFGYDSLDPSTRLAYSICRVGKTMKKYDIVGRLCGGQTLYAQVKSDAKKKYKKLLKQTELTKNDRFVLFSANTDIETGILDKNVFFISVHRVFHAFQNSDDEKERQLLKDMILMGLPQKY